MKLIHHFGAFLVAAGLTAGCSNKGPEGPVEVDVAFDDASQRVHVLLSRGLKEGETLHTQVRRGELGELDCATDFGGIPRIDGDKVKDSRPALRWASCASRRLRAHL
ncbi:MAG: hypothetical protein AAF721_18955 [Myxococcota bacterium]